MPRTSPPLVLLTGYILTAFLGSHLPIPGNLAQAVLDVLGCRALLLLLSVAWNQGRIGAWALGRMTVLAARTLAFPVAVAVFVVAVGLALLGVR